MWTAPASLRQFLDQARAHHQRLVLVTGVFDILHAEHERFLQKAKAIGDILLIGIETDHRVRELKGEGRPVNNQEKRQLQLEALGIADQVFILPEHFHTQADYENLIAVIQPQVLAVSSHSPYLENKRLIMSQFGGEVAVVHEHNPAISTTQILAAQRH